MISDLVLSGFAFYLYFQHRILNRNWSFFFLFMGVSALIGGLYHGFDFIGEEFRFLSWAVLSISLIFAQFAAYKSVDNKALKWFFVQKAALFLFFSIFYASFTFMIIDMVISLIGFVILGNIFYLKNMSNLITYGILISLSSAVFVIFKINLDSNFFMANDLGHYVTVISLFVMSRGVREDTLKTIFEREKVKNMV